MIPYVEHYISSGTLMKFLMNSKLIKKRKYFWRIICRNVGNNDRIVIMKKKNTRNNENDL